MVDDDKFKELFSKFEPELSPESLLMSALQRNIDTVEMVRRHHAAFRRRNRLAVVIAACTGFLSGVAFALLLPLAGEWISSVQMAIPFTHFMVETIDYGFVSWILMAGVSALMALNAYRMAMAGLPSQCVNQLT